MHLKTLTLRGFKSFASATTLRLEPGITCVVGPNGSGKSNVVDGLAWVMGEQGAKTLRGGRMEDVIFAGTAGRAPLGRAEVSLTIDNTDGALPIDFTEVTISRTMFRSGGSDYAINGTPCRLLDVQELLSDSGIGREMHVIVGQGQLDAVLHASPEDRRGFIEEAAGVLKHRKRKEKALRKLDSMQVNLTRLADLTTEIRRQLKPLGRQAEVARRAAVVQADLRDARALLLADDLVQLSTTLAADIADEKAMRERREEVEAALVAAREQVASLELLAADAAPRLARAQDTWYRLSGLRERMRGTASLAADRERLLGDAEPERRPGPDPEDLLLQAATARAQEDALREQVEAVREVLETAVERRHEAEAAEGAEERRLQARLRAAADRREGLARLAGQVAARRSRVEAGEEEVERLAEAIAEAQERAEDAQRDFSAVELEVAGDDVGEEDLGTAHEAASSALAAAEAEVERLRATEREAERDRATWTARRETLELSLRRKDGAAVLLTATDRPAGVLGSVAELVQVDESARAGVAAALGPLAEAVAVTTAELARRAVAQLRAQDAGQVTVVVADMPASTAPAAAGRPPLPPGARWAGDLVQVPQELGPVLRRAVDAVVLVPDERTGCELVRSHPDLVAVDPSGMVVRAGVVQGGSAGTPSLLEVQAAVAEAADRARAAAERAATVLESLQGAKARREWAVIAVEEALTRLRERDARGAAVAQRLGQFGATAKAARAEVARLAGSLAGKQAALVEERVQLTALEERWAEASEVCAEDAEDGDEPSTAERDRLAAAASAARAHEMEARLALRTAEERTRAMAGRADQLERAATTEQEERERSAVRSRRRERERAVARSVLAGARWTLGVLETVLARAEQERESAESERSRRDTELSTARTALSRLAEEYATITDSAHRDEVARAQQRIRIEAMRQRSIDELGMDPDILVEEYGPHQLVPPSPSAPGDKEPAEPPRPMPFVRAQQEKRLRSAERALALLGTVNPLALEEFAALEERHKFLTEQLEDLKTTRKDLLEIVREVDERVEQVFTEAYRDTAEQFVRVFSRLFPGGEGRLVLTDPSNMLTTGVEVEARPPGKKVKRLSLLSGGERSLTAVALLVAIFKARPSPFYVLDEVEAALDDTNLGRLITILEELRESSQLIVITHQKRTMEVADALYGVTMRGDGVTTVVSQRLRGEQPA